jgi:hypothetical protein
MLQASKTCPLLGTLLLALAFPVWGQGYVGENPQVVVSVYDDAGVRADSLAQAEQRAAKIFGHAGVDVIWKNCSSSANPTGSPNQIGPDALVRAGEQSSQSSIFEENAGLRPAGRVGALGPTLSGLEDGGCLRLDWPTHLAVRVVPQSRRSINDVFGVAFLSAEGTGCYSDVFYDRAAELQTAWNVSLTDVLGNVMAHELGHLLLGSNSHTATGIMRARWQAAELRRAGEGSLSFNAEQAERMRGKLRAAIPGLAVAARAGLSAP